MRVDDYQKSELRKTQMGQDKMNTYTQTEMNFLLNKKGKITWLYGLASLLAVDPRFRVLPTLCVAFFQDAYGHVSP